MLFKLKDLSKTFLASVADPGGGGGGGCGSGCSTGSFEPPFAGESLQFAPPRHLCTKSELIALFLPRPPDVLTFSGV